MSVYGSLMEVIDKDTIDVIFQAPRPYCTTLQTMQNMDNGTRTTKAMPVCFSFKMIRVSELADQSQTRWWNTTLSVSEYVSFILLLHYLRVLFLTASPAVLR